MVSTNEEVVSEVPLAEQINTEIQGITEEDFEKAQKTFQLGKKNLFLNKYDESVNNFGDACKIFSSKYGEMDPQCADIYYFYGRALLELARVENTVLGNALNGVPEETGPIDDSRYGNPDDVAAEEKKEISEKVIDALCENPDDLKTEAATIPTTETTETAVIPATTEVTEGEKPTETTTEAATEETGECEAEGEEEGDEEEEAAEGEEEDIRNDEQVKDEAEAEDISNLQRSWEMFELAKLIYSKNFDNDLQFRNKRMAECLLKLGEISIEQEIYEQAITDITESIRLQEELEQRDERMLAESYYQLGLAQQFNNLFTEANETYQKSINIMQLRIEKLNGRLSTIQDGADADLERNTIKDEIAELEALIPEMQSKLEEVNEQGQQSLNLIKEAKECFLNNMSEESKTNGTTNGDVKDITNLVKSKRKFSASEECETTKKTRVSTDGTTVEVTESVPEVISTETPVPEPVATA
jgi:nuclear autoantigenic sperm protein